MDKKKSERILIITSFISIVILLIGATFSYFSASTSSDKDALKVKADKVELGLSISTLYNEHKLIPTNDSDILTAYNQKCVDNNGYGACSAYELTVSNFYKEQDVIGTIDFDIDHINNLSYMLLDEDGNVYLPKTSIGSTSVKGLPLGSSFTIKDGTSDNPTVKKFILIVWLTNLDDTKQDDFDANGSFSANVIYHSVAGSELTGTIKGLGDNNNGNNTSEVGD